MLYSDKPRRSYSTPTCHEVICQLTFPSILSINRDEPIDFQETVRGTFPRYARTEDKNKLVNYHLISSDGQSRLNLTRDFISLSALSYPGWESFAGAFDRPLASFIKLYNPAYFSRIGLRYINFISRQKLALEYTPWSELLAQPYASILAEEDCPENGVLQLSNDFILKPENEITAHVHSGLGRVKSNLPGAKEDPELKFILDIDVYVSGSIECTRAAELLNKLHSYASSIYEGAITDELRRAME